MIQITDIPDWVIKLSKLRAAKLGKLNNSITSGGGNIAGYLGQIIVARYLKATDIDDFNYDILKGDVRYEVKTKRCTSEPKPDYECSVAAANTRQKCDYYIFVRVLEDMSCAWILGRKSPTDYYKQARFCKKGEVDPKSSFGWKFKGDCYNLEIKDLDEI